MQVMAKAAERREHQREYEPSRQLNIIVNGQTILSENWSMGGFRSYGLFQFDKKDRFEGSVAGHDGGSDIPFTGQVVRVEEDGARIVRLVEIELDHLLTLRDTTSG